MAADAARWVASPTSTVPGGATRLEPAGGVDEIARDHALVRGAERDGGLAGQHPGACLDPGPETRDARRPARAPRDGPLGIVLVRHRRAPDRHDRVADELLDGAAIAADHVGREVEVAGQELADVLGVAAPRRAA